MIAAAGRAAGERETLKGFVRTFLAATFLRAGLFSNFLGATLATFLVTFDRVDFVIGFGADFALFVFLTDGALALAADFFGDALAMGFADFLLAAPRLAMGFAGAAFVLTGEDRPDAGLVRRVLDRADVREEGGGVIVLRKRRKGSKARRPTGHRRGRAEPAERD